MDGNRGTAGRKNSTIIPKKSPAPPAPIPKTGPDAVLPGTANVLPKEGSQPDELSKLPSQILEGEKASAKQIKKKVNRRRKKNNTEHWQPARIV